MHLAAVSEARAGRNTFRSVNRLHPFMCLVVVYCHSCLSDPSLEPDSWPVSFGETRVSRAFTIAGARASASAGARASASAWARAAAGMTLSNEDACDTVRAGEIRDAINASVRAAVIAPSVRDAAFGCDAVSSS